MKLIFQALILIVSFSMLACGKQNPTNTQSDPLRGREFKGATKLLDPKENDGPPKACPKSYTMVIRAQNGQVVDQENLSFIAGQKTTYQIEITPEGLNPSLVNQPKNMELAKTKTPGFWNLIFTPTEDQRNNVFNSEITLPVPADDICVKGISAELLVSNVNDGKILPSVNVIDLNQKDHYPSTSVQVFHADVVDPNIQDSETPKPPIFDFSNFYGTDQDGNYETLFLSAKDAVKCNPNAAKIAEKTFRFTCSIDFKQIPMNVAGEQFGHTDFKIYGVSVNNDKSIEQSIGMPILYPASAQPQPPVKAADDDSTKKKLDTTTKKSTKKVVKNKSGDNT